MRRLPIRRRLTLAFTLVMAIVLTLTGLVLYLRFRSGLDRAIADALQARSSEITALVRQNDDELGAALEGVTGTGDDFAQVLTPDGHIVATTPQASDGPLLRGPTLERASDSLVIIEHPPLDALDGPLMLRAYPEKSRKRSLIVVVGTTLGPRNDSLRTLAALLGIGAGVALLLAALAGYAVATGALRPVDSMRRRAAEIDPSVTGQRLPVPPSDDEVARLGVTLNEMLARLETAFVRERAFVADASHELRTPLGILKAELELALRDGRSPAELRAALESAAEETDRLVALAEDLLVIARLDQGRLPIRSEELDVGELFASVAARFGAPGRESEREVRVAGGQGLQVCGDPDRLEQALGNMVDNALRHGAGHVELSAVQRAGRLELRVTDDGPGFPPDFLGQAFERFARADSARARGGTGLGLAIVAAIATSHGGRAHAANRPDGGGAEVWLELPSAARSRPPEPAVLSTS